MKSYDHFDTSVIAEIYTDNPRSKQSREKCREYLYKVLTKYQNARVSMLNLGELKKVILFKIKENNNKLKVLEELKMWFDKGIEFCSPQWKAFEIALELKEKDHFLEPLDILHIATAIENGAKRFVTIEDNILENQIFTQHVKKEYGLKIIPP